MPGLELATASHSVAAENVTAGQERKHDMAQTLYIHLLMDSKATTAKRESTAKATCRLRWKGKKVGNICNCSGLYKATSLLDWTVQWEKVNKRRMKLQSDWGISNKDNKPFFRIMTSFKSSLHACCTRAIFQPSCSWEHELYVVGIYGNIDRPACS